MELQHFSHKHPLILMEVPKKKGGRVTCCAGCLKPILGAAYSCTVFSEITDKECNFFLHKRCAELPDEIKNLLHHHHELSLLKDEYLFRPQQCDVCGKYCGEFYYGCNICTFRICLSCCLEESNVTITHESHRHPLTLLSKKASFFCNICGTEDKDFSYLCYTCQFSIHKSCAMLPNTAYSIEHQHPLTLVKRPTFNDLISQSWENCNICHEIFIRNSWYYKCDHIDHSSYFAHVKCATSESEQISLITSENEPGESLGVIKLSLPPADGFTVLMRDLVEQNNIEQTGGETKIIHWSHEQHPLILFNVQNSYEMKDDIILCNCCVQAISLPFYSCEECNYFLHLYCANLPRELRHPIIHPKHPLQLIYDSKFNDIFRCTACFSYTNGFFYECCEGCFVQLDVRCAFLPGGIAHEAHEHPLFQIESSVSNCSACAIYSRVKFKCHTCKFVVCQECALLPHTIKHRWDPHPFTLTYPPFNDLADEFYCEFCEEEINQKLWMYHCSICNQSFHPGCIYDQYSNVKFGSIVQVNDHPHPLMFVRKLKRGKCFRCIRYSIENPFFQCQECDYAICNGCIKL